MYERMTDKTKVPEIAEIEQYIGAESSRRLQLLDEKLQERYVINRELRYPFGASYGWGYKYSHKSKHLFYLFFERDALTATVQIGDKEVPALVEQLRTFSTRAQSLWESRYPCGKDGGWVHFRILTDNDLDDVVKFIAIKKQPVHTSRMADL